MSSVTDASSLKTTDTSIAVVNGSDYERKRRDGAIDQRLKIPDPVAPGGTWNVEVEVEDRRPLTALFSFRSEHPRSRHLAAEQRLLLLAVRIHDAGDQRVTDDVDGGELHHRDAADRSRTSSASRRPDLAPKGRSICDRSPVMAIREFSPNRVRNTFIWVGVVF